MGLMYIFPKDKTEIDRVSYPKNGGICVKSYGLPLIFWGYFLAMFITLFAMIVAIWGPLMTVFRGDDDINKLLAVTVIALLTLIPFASLALLFFEKRIVKKEDQLYLQYFFFFIKCWSKKINLSKSTPFKTTHFSDTPNMAKKSMEPDLKNFRNSGYFKLSATTDKQKDILIDRNSRKQDLLDLSELLQEY
jgi:hypothetical protein